MKKQMISLLLVLAMAAMPLFSGALAEEGTLDPFEEITAEFAAAVKVEPYKVAVQPTRVSGWTALRWAPSKNAPIMATYSAKQELMVLKETDNWLLVANEKTGDIGYINKAYVTTDLPKDSPAREMNLTGENGKLSLGVVDINGAFSLESGLPAGYNSQLVRSSSDQLVALLTSEDPQKPSMVLSVAYDPAYASVDRLNDLDDEALAELEKTFTEVDPTVEITYGDTGLGTRLMVARQNDKGFDYLDFVTIYKGYFVEFVMVAPQTAEEKTLTEEQMLLCVDFLTDLDFVPVEAAAADTSLLADGKYITNFTAYDSDANTLQMEVRHSVTLDPAVAEALQVGDTLTVGSYSEKIEKLEKNEDGDILINDSLILQNFGGEEHLYIDFEEYDEVYMELTLQVPEDLKFYDYTDPETGEATDELVEHTAEEMISMLLEDPLSFASGNVWSCFDINGQLIAVERYGAF